MGNRSENSPSSYRLLGSQRVLLHDHMDSADFFSWQVSNPEQDWAWQRAVPQQTRLDGNMIQPGADHLSASGHYGWVTGANTGANTGSHDVDGITWLTSPRFQANGLTHLQWLYSRWFANAGGHQDDRLQVESSNDDGASWILLETVSHAPRWESVSFE